MTDARVHVRVTAGILAAVVGGTVTAGPAAAAQTTRDWWHDRWEMSQVWEVADGAGVTVAVVDTGIEADLPAFAGAVTPGVDLVEDGGDGTVDHGSTGHGTVVAAMVGARGGPDDVYGVAPGATLLPVATSLADEDLPVEGWRDEELAEAIREAVDHGADVVNMSLTVDTPECTDPVVAEVERALARGVVLVAGAGNDPAGDTAMPANCPGVVTVGAVDSAFDPWSDSHRSRHVDVAAPGVDLGILRADGQTARNHGTSLAAALVSGVVALVRAHDPDASAREVVTRLLATAQDVGPEGWDEASGGGCCAAVGGVDC